MFIWIAVTQPPLRAMAIPTALPAMVQPIATNGNVTEYTDDGSGQATITITCGGDPRYVINNIGFNGAIPNDFSWAHGVAANVATITDTDVDNGNMYFVVTVQDTTANCTFGCDPGVTNTTKPPM
jgi:hypothetical protein